MFTRQWLHLASHFRLLVAVVECEARFASSGVADLTWSQQKILCMSATTTTDSIFDSFTLFLSLFVISCSLFNYNYGYNEEHF